MTESIGKKATTGALWATGSKLGYMVLQFVVNLVLTRLLGPTDIGIVGMLMIFIIVSQTLLDGGFGAALIQKKDSDQTDYSTIFFWNLGMGILLYGIIFATAPMVADFYRIERLSGILRVFGLTLLIDGVTGVQTTRLRKELAFRQIAIATLSSYGIGACMGITLALNGAGVWSLIAMTLFSGLANMTILYIYSGWRPSAVFSRKSLRELFGFGGYMLAAQVLQEACKNVQGLVIGRRFNATQLGFYSQAQKLDLISSYALPQMIVQVMYPVYSKIRDDKERLRDVLKMNIRVISILMWPILGLLIIIADPLIKFLYGEVWMPAAVYFKIMCIGGMFVSLQNINFYTVAAYGKSRTLFYWSFYKWGFLLAMILGGSYLGMKGIVWGLTISNINIYLVNALLAGRHTGLGILQQMRLLLPISLGVGSALAAAMAMAYQYGVNPILSGVCYVVILATMTVLFNRTTLKECVMLYKKIRER